MGGAVGLEALRRLDLHAVVVARVQGDMDPATVPGGHGVHQSAVHLADFKGHTLDPLGLVRFGHLDQLQAAHRSVVKLQGLSVTHLDLDALGAGIEHITVQAPDFFRNDGHTGLQALNYNPAILIGQILAVVAAQHLPV